MKQKSIKLNNSIPIDYKPVKKFSISRDESFDGMAWRDAKVKEILSHSPKKFVGRSGFDNTIIVADGEVKWNEDALNILDTIQLIFTANILDNYKNLPNHLKSY